MWWGVGGRRLLEGLGCRKIFPEPLELCRITAVHLRLSFSYLHLHSPFLYKLLSTVRVLNDEVTTQGSFISPTSKPPFLLARLGLVTQNIKAIAFPITWVTCAD